MQVIPLRLKADPYRIIIGRGILSALGRHIRTLTDVKDCILITHPAILRAHGADLVKGLKSSGIAVKILPVPAGEKSKSVKRAFQLMETIARYDVMKKIWILAFGGGVIGDLAGYVAAVYKRGIPYVQIPTTFLAQIDSAIGGKVAVDLKVGKNLIGAFHQPRVVWSDISVLSTLSPRQIRNGLAEAVKYGIIRDADLFDFIAAHYRQILAQDPAILEKVIARCALIKARIVSQDERETRGIRTILNFGHTVGHAIEAAGNYARYQHGEAIALGMRIAAEISLRLKLLSGKDNQRINQVLTDIALPERINGVSLNAILAHMRHDKKFLAGRNRFVLAQKIGQVKVVENIPQKTILRAIMRFYRVSAE